MLLGKPQHIACIPVPWGGRWLGSLSLRRGSCKLGSSSIPHPHGFCVSLSSIYFPRATQCLQQVHGLRLSASV